MKQSIYLIVVLVLEITNGSLFDLMDVDDPFALLWNTKNPAFERKLTCTVTNADGLGNTEGKCIHYSHCLLSGGTPNGICGIVNTCCTYVSKCGQETKSKVSYFSGTYEHSGHNDDDGCIYRIQLLPNVCQVRLDFEQFQFEPPIFDPVTSSNRYNSDYLTVTPNYYGLPIFGGNNDNQHAYVHVNRTFESRVMLSVVLASRTDNQLSVANPIWKIKVTQLHCGGNRDFINLRHRDDPNKKDLLMLAPLGTVQYFTKAAGNFRTFGIPAGLSPNSPIAIESNSYTYISDLKYAIAFKRYPHICGVRFTPIYAQFADPESQTKCTDYLFVPEWSITDTDRQSEWCARLPDEFSFSPTGPLTIFFNTALTYTEAPINLFGFNINYALISCH